jgi:branched-chain amino acid transport system substrate-binding protein
VAAATSRLVWNHGGARAGSAPNIINVLAPADTYFIGTVEVVRRADPEASRACVLHTDTGFSRAVADGGARAARRLGMKATNVPFVAEPSAAELLLVVGGFADEQEAARRLLPGPWRAAGFVGAGVEDVLAALGPRREGLLGPAQWLPSAAPDPDVGPSPMDFVEAYRRLTGREPSYPAAQAFAAGLVAARCLRDAGTPDDTAMLAAARAVDCTTLFGRFRLDPTGRQTGQEVLTVQWQDGSRRVVWPPDRAEAALRYPLQTITAASSDR